MVELADGLEGRGNLLTTLIPLHRFALIHRCHVAIMLAILVVAELDDLHLVRVLLSETANRHAETRRAVVLSSTAPTHRIDRPRRVVSNDLLVTIPRHNERIASCLCNYNVSYSTSNK